MYLLKFNNKKKVFHATVFALHHKFGSLKNRPAGGKVLYVKTVMLFQLFFETSLSYKTFLFLNLMGRLQVFLNPEKYRAQKEKAKLYRWSMTWFVECNRS